MTVPPPTPTDPGTTLPVSADPTVPVPGTVTRQGRSAPGHLGAVDVVRFLTVGGVILVHTTSLTAPKHSDLAAAAVLEVFHVTRSVFLFLSAFVLTYSFRRRPLGSRAFWRRRYPLVVVPYVVWSAIYVATGPHHSSPLGVTGKFLLDLFDGGAHFHLYFLLLTFQLYLVFPALMAAVHRWPRAVKPAVAAAAAFQLLFTAGVHYGWRPPVLGIWLGHTGSWLPSYLLYVVGGVAAGLHFTEVTAWVRTHTRLIVVAFVASVALAEASFVADVQVLGYPLIRASEVFQPATVIEAVTATLAQYALGLWAVERLPRRRLAQLERSSDVSFGVYLAHPLLVGAVLDLAVASGLSAAVGQLPAGAVEAMVALGLVPVVYLVTFVVIDRVRRTPASLALTGRRGARSARPVPVPRPA